MSAQQLAEDLAARLDLRKRPRSWGGDCPSCSYHGAFSLKVSLKLKRPVLHCANGCSKEQLNAEAERVLGSQWTPAPPSDEAEAARARGAKQAASQRLWNGSTALTSIDPVGRYLARRGLPHLLGSAALRYRADCWHPEGGRLRAMVALVQDAAGRPVACHRTYLTAEGMKATADPPKASLGPVWGGAVRLDPIAPELVIGEGIETAASAGLLLGLPAWAALSAGNMAAGMILPAEVRSLVIAADHDGPGRKAAQDAARRWRAEGRSVRIATPDRTGADFNDILRERLHA